MKSRSSMPALLLLGALSAGCAAPRNDHPVTTGIKPPAVPVRAVVFCADGAGGFGATTEALRESLGDCSPVRVEMVDYTHGKWRILADHMDHCNILEHGRCLAQKVQALRASRPDLAIHFVGHSAGTAVVLAAAERLQPGTIDNIVLLAPSLSARYDLRPALASTRLGIHAFISKADLLLAINMPIGGTTDRRWGRTAGRVGFQRIGDCPRDVALYSRLYQHFWDPSQAKTGHKGGHFGSFEDGYLRAYVLPLLGPNPLPRMTVSRR